MLRRRFLAASLAASASLVRAQSPAPNHPRREYYHLRRYSLRMGPQAAQAERYFADALLPALTRLGCGPVGAFKLEYGSETPVYFLLVPGSDLEPLAALDLRLAADEAFLKTAEPFWAAPSGSPAFERIESTLLLAFEGWPKLTAPAGKGKRIFQLRTYESPSHAAHVRKVEMFHHGEFDIFTRTGLHPVFFADTLVGARMPSLTYMLSFADMRELEANWAFFSADPAWKKLSSDPRYAYEPIVSNISNLILSPLRSSQI